MIELPGTVVTLLASFLVWGMFLGLFVLWIVDGRAKRAFALHGFFASLISWVVAEMVKTLFPVARPFTANGEAPMTFTVPGLNSSFPSTHTAVAFSLGITIWLHNRKIGILFLLMAFLVGLGRVLANVHYPLDVLAGAILGSVVAFATEKIHFYKLITGKTRG